MNYQNTLDYGSNILRLNNIKTFQLDCELILSDVLNKKREEILINLNDKIDQKQLKKFKFYLSKRKKKEPIAYLLGYKHFWKYKFLVDKSALIPRPETEQIVEQALKFIPTDCSKMILDIGTGTGCIIISILKERSKCKATALDISLKALKIAKTNAKLHHLENKIKFINIDIDKYKSNKYDLILSNPPYINDIDLSRLDDDIKFYEPKEALSGGLNGYKEIKKIIEKSSKILKINGRLIFEIGDSQKEYAKKLLKNNGMYINKIIKDLSGKDRCIVSTKLNK